MSVLDTQASRRWIDWAIIACIAVMAVGMLMPFLWLFSMSFRPVSEAYQLPPSFLPPNLDFSNYAAVLASRVPFLQIYANSLVTILPIYLGYARTGLINQPIGLALMYLTSSFGVFLMRQFMVSQPKALEEAALMDGAGYFKIFWRISLPQLRPALSALGIITFTQTWNYYFQAKVLLGREQSMTLPVAMDVLRGYLGSGNLSLVMAAMSMSILPVVLLFLIAQKFVIEGITMTGIKN
jgi:multiple sugar transport system permease protein